MTECGSSAVHYVRLNWPPVCGIRDDDATVTAMPMEVKGCDVCLRAANEDAIGNYHGNGDTSSARPGI